MEQMVSFKKYKYVKLELSHYELHMISSILGETKMEKGDWFTKGNFEDLKGVIDDAIKKINEV